jgi:hypothetical protein
MSWDVMVFDLAGAAPSEIDFGADFKPHSMGPAGEIRLRISEHLRAVDWSDPTWGLYEGDGFSLEFNMGKGAETNSFMVHVRGGGDAVKTLLRVAAPNGWSLFDCTTGEFIDPANPSDEGWKAFQGYRDRVLRGT